MEEREVTAGVELLRCVLLLPATRMCITELPQDMSSAVKVVADDGQFQSELSSAGSKLVVVDFTASWCGPCKRIAPFYDELSAKYSKAIFLKVS